MAAAPPLDGLAVNSAAAALTCSRVQPAGAAISAASGAAAGGGGGAAATGGGGGGAAAAAGGGGGGGAAAAGGGAGGGGGGAETTGSGAPAPAGIAAEVPARCAWTTAWSLSAKSGSAVSKICRVVMVLCVPPGVLE